MPIDPHRIEVMDDRTTEIMRRLTPADKLILMDAMWRIVRSRMLKEVRRMRPAQSWAATRAETNWRMWNKEMPADYDHDHVRDHVAERLAVLTKRANREHDSRERNRVTRD